MKIFGLALVVIILLCAFLGSSIALFSANHEEGGEILGRFYTPLLVVHLLLSILVGVAYKTAPSPDRRRFWIVSSVLTLLYSALDGLIITVIANMLTRHTYPSTAWWIVVAIGGAFHISVVVHFIAEARPKMRGGLYNALVGLPSAFHFCGVSLSILLLPVSASLPAKPLFLIVPFFPFALSLIGVAQSVYNSPWERVTAIAYGKSASKELGSVGKPKRSPFTHTRLDRPPTTPIRDDKRTLSFIQVTDPHLGTFMSVEKLRETCNKIVELNPDLVFLTGDFYCPQGQETPNSLRDALQPLSALKGKVFACYGNHDKESERIMKMVKGDLEGLDVVVLADAITTVETKVGKLAITGIDYYWKPEVHLPRIFERLTCPEDCVGEVVMLHDPKGFAQIPPNRKCLTISGHTHGGQIGFLSLGLNGTLVGLLGPDHGLWEQGNNRLYVHRGQGFRSLTGNLIPRIGIPNENSLFELQFEA